MRAHSSYNQHKQKFYYPESVGTLENTERANLNGFLTQTGTENHGTQRQTDNSSSQNLRQRLLQQEDPAASKGPNLTLGQSVSVGIYNRHRNQVHNIKTTGGVQLRGGLAINGFSSREAYGVASNRGQQQLSSSVERQMSTAMSQSNNTLVPKTQNDTMQLGVTPTTMIEEMNNSLEQYKYQNDRQVGSSKSSMNNLPQTTNTDVDPMMLSTDQSQLNYMPRQPMTNSYAQRAALYSRQDAETSIKTGSYALGDVTRQVTRPMTQDQYKGKSLKMKNRQAYFDAVSSSNYNAKQQAKGTGNGRVQHHLLQMTTTQNTLNETRLSTSQSLKLRASSVQRDEGASNRSIKLIVTRAELTQEKKNQKHWQQMTRTSYPLQYQTAAESEFATNVPATRNQYQHENNLAPKTLALMRETHLNESSVSLMPKTGKAGIFQIERSQTTTGKNFNQGGQSQYKSLYELPGRRRKDAPGESTQKTAGAFASKLKMPDIRHALKNHQGNPLKLSLENTNESNTISQSVSERGSATAMNKSWKVNPKGTGSAQLRRQIKGITSTNGPRLIAALPNNNKSLSPMRLTENSMVMPDARQTFSQQESLMIQMKHQESQQALDTQVNEMQADLQDLIKMEPYAHRARQLQASQESQQLNLSMPKALQTQSQGNREKRAAKMTNKEIESWLNDTLEVQLQEIEEEKHRLLNQMNKSRGQAAIDELNIPSKHVTNKSPLITLEIDRIALDKAGVAADAVNRIYKGLYAGSVGVFDTMRMSLENVPKSEKYKVMGNLWRCFEMLLQNCCPTDFQMVGQKLLEDSMYEINMLKSNFTKYKLELEDTNKKNLAKLKEMQQQFTEVSEEKEIQIKKRQESDFKLLGLQTKFEDEVRLRLDIEIKINKLHNLTKVMKNHEVTLNRRIEELELSQKDFKIRCQTQAEEIVSLRSYKRQSEMKKEENEAEMQSVKLNELQTKEKLITVTESMQQKENDLASKTNLTMQLQSVVDNRDSRIRALTDIVEEAKMQQQGIDAQYNQYHKQIELQEKSIKEFMKGISEQDAELSNAKNVLNDAEFNEFEFQMAQNRVRDLEAQLDKLLTSTLTQRQTIEDFELQVAKLTTENERLQKSEKEKIEKIFELSETRRNLEKGLKSMTAARDKLEKQGQEMADMIKRRSDKINELEVQVYQLERRVDDLERCQEQMSADMTQLRQQLDQFREASHSWEDKYHKQAIVREKAEKRASELQFEIRQLKTQQEEKTRNIEQQMDDKQIIVDALRTDLDNIMGPMRQFRNRHMRLAIKAKLLHWLLHSYLEHCITQHGRQGRHIVKIESELETQKAEYEQNLALKERAIERRSCESEDLRSQGLRILDAQNITTRKLMGLENVVENLKARIFLLDQELQQTEKERDKKVEFIKQLEASQEILKEKHQESLKQAKLKADQDQKLFIEKINDQGAKIKQLAGNLNQLGMKVVVDEVKKVDAQVQTDDSKGPAAAAAPKTQALKTVQQFDAETQTDFIVAAAIKLSVKSAAQQSGSTLSQKAFDKNADLDVHHSSELQYFNSKSKSISPLMSKKGMNTADQESSHERQSRGTGQQFSSNHGRSPKKMSSSVALKHSADSHRGGAGNASAMVDQDSGLPVDGYDQLVQSPIYELDEHFNHYQNPQGRHSTLKTSSKGASSSGKHNMRRKTGSPDSQFRRHQTNSGLEQVRSRVSVFRQMSSQSNSIVMNNSDGQSKIISRHHSGSKHAVVFESQVQLALGSLNSGSGGGFRASSHSNTRKTSVNAGQAPLMSNQHSASSIPKYSNLPIDFQHPSKIQVIDSQTELAFQQKQQEQLVQQQQQNLLQQPQPSLQAAQPKQPSPQTQQPSQQQQQRSSGSNALRNSQAQPAAAQRQQRQQIKGFLKSAFNRP